MTLKPRARWLLYAIAGIATLAAMHWVDGRAAAEAPVVTAVAAPQARHTVAAALDDTRVRLDWLRRGSIEELPRGNPFAQQAQPPTQVQPNQQQQVEPPSALEQAPPLPFTYMGTWTEQGHTTIYLARGERHVAVRGRGKLDDTYTVETIDDRQIVLNYVPLNIRQVLPLLPGEHPVQPSSATPEAATSETGEGRN